MEGVSQMSAAKNKRGQAVVNGDAGSLPGPRILPQDDAFNAFVNGLSVETSVRKTFKPATLSECVYGAGQTLARDWSLKTGQDMTGDEFAIRAETLAARLGTDVVADVRSRMLEMAAALTAAAGGLSADDVEVSKTSGRVTCRTSVRDVESGASASISVPLPTDKPYGMALASVAPERPAR